MYFLRHSLNVVDVPEQLRIAAMRDLVVRHRAIGSRMLGNAERTGALASVVVSDEYLLPQLLPSCRLVPRTPRSHGIALLVSALLIAGSVADSRGEATNARR